MLRWISSLASWCISLTWAIIFIFSGTFWFLVSSSSRNNSIIISKLFIVGLLWHLHHSQWAVLLLVCISLLSLMVLHANNALPGDIRCSSSLWHLVKLTSWLSLGNHGCFIWSIWSIFFINIASFIQSMLGIHCRYVLFWKSRHMTLLMRWLLIWDSSNVRVLQRGPTTCVIDGVWYTATYSSSTTLSVGHVTTCTCVTFVCSCSWMDVI